MPMVKNKCYVIEKDGQIYDGTIEEVAKASGISEIAIYNAKYDGGFVKHRGWKYLGWYRREVIVVETYGQKYVYSTMQEAAEKTGYGDSTLYNIMNHKFNYKDIKVYKQLNSWNGVRDEQKRNNKLSKRKNRYY